MEDLRGGPKVEIFKSRFGVQILEGAQVESDVPSRIEVGEIIGVNVVCIMTVDVEGDVLAVREYSYAVDRSWS